MTPPFLRLMLAALALLSVGEIRSADMEKTSR